MKIYSFAKDPTTQQIVLRFTYDKLVEQEIRRKVPPKDFIWGRNLLLFYVGQDSLFSMREIFLKHGYAYCDWKTDPSEFDTNIRRAGETWIDSSGGGHRSAVTEKPWWGGYEDAAGADPYEDDKDPFKAAPHDWDTLRDLFGNAGYSRGPRAGWPTSSGNYGETSNPVGDRVRHGHAPDGYGSWNEFFNAKAAEEQRQRPYNRPQRPDGRRGPEPRNPPPGHGPMPGSPFYGPRGRPSRFSDPEYGDDEPYRQKQTPTAPAKTQSEYEILGIPDGSSIPTIKQAWRQLIAAHHPDKGGDHETAAKINAAYQRLKVRLKFK